MKMSDMHQSAPIIVRERSEADIGAVAAMIERGFVRHIEAELEVVGQVAFRMYVTGKALRQRCREGAVGFVAELDGNIVGYAELRDSSGPAAGYDHLTLLFTDPDHLRIGIARALLGRVRRFLAEHAPDLSAITVNASRYAMPAYRALGFVPVHEETEHKGIIHTPMRLVL